MLCHFRFLKHGSSVGWRRPVDGTMTDPITRLNAALEGRYRVEREIGEGGMAQRVRAIYDQILSKWGLLVPPRSRRP